MRIRFEPSGRCVEVEPGTLLLEATRRAGLPIARACGAEGLCGRCAIEILEGSDRLEAESAPEASAKRRNRVSPKARLACQVVVAGDLVVTASYW